MSLERAPKRPRARLMSRLRATTFFIGAAALYLAARPALANPQGGVVVGGQATITASAPNTVTIDQSSKIVIVDWNSFNIGKGETTRFVQPNATSTAVNRIGGDAPSVILGDLDANGRVILINGDGLVFGAGAKINVGSLIATTHDASNADLMSGKATFDGPGSSTASITNNGRINASSGVVGLIAPAVANNGTIRAKLSGVTLGAASQFTLDFTGDGLVSFPVDAQVLSRALDASGKPVQALVVNQGRIVGATVLLTAQAAQDIVENAISMGGLIRASAVRQSGGSIVLDGSDGAVSVTGTLNASDKSPGATGGVIEVLGDSLTLGSTARLDASGDAGGGSIFVGGDLHGAGPLPDATNTVVAAGATLKADAITQGDGGTVVVWADGATTFAGAISATGGATSGNGGYVETSGKQSLTVADGATVDTLAPKGAAGDWLLDPATITIASSGSGTLAEGATTSDDSSSITISTATLDAATSNVILAAAGSIMVTSAIALTNPGVGITFEGAGANPAAGPNSGTTLLGNITTNNGAVTIDGATLLGNNVVISTGTGAVDFAGTVDNLFGIIIGFGGASGGTASGFALTIINSGATTFGGAVGATNPIGSLTTGTGTTTFDGDVSTNNSAVTINGATTLGSDVAINAGTGAVSFGGAVDSAGGVNGQYALAIDGSGPVTFGGAIGPSVGLTGLTTGTGTTTLNGYIGVNGAISFGGPVTLGSDVTINGGFTNSVTFTGAVDGAHNLTFTDITNATFESTVGANTPLTSLNVQGVGTTTLDGDVTTNGAVAVLGATALGGAVTINAGTGALTFSGVVDGAHALSITTTGITNFKSGFTGLTGLTTGAGATIVSGGTVSISGPTVLSGDLTIDPPVGAVTFSGTVDGAHNLTIENIGVTFGGAVGGTTPLASLTTDYDARTTLDGDVTTTGPVTLNAPVTLGGNVTINAGAGAVALANGVNGGGYALTITTTGATSYSSGLSDLSAFTSGSGPTTLGGSITTTNGPVTLNGAATLGQNVTINAGTGAVAFNSTIDGAYLLDIINSGGVTFAGAVGANTPLTSLTTGTGATTLDGGITTTNGAVFGGDVSTNGDAITINGPTRLGGDVSTNNGALTIDGATTLGTDVTVNAGTGGVDFAGAVDSLGPGASQHALAVNGSGPVTFGGTIGPVWGLSGLTTGAGTTTLNGYVGVNGTISFGGPVTLGSDVTINGGFTNSVTFMGAVDGPHSLTFTDLANTTFDGNVTVSGGLTVNGATTLGGDVTVNAGTAPISFDGPVDGAYNLVLTTSGTMLLSTTVGQTTPLASLTTGTGAIQLGGNITTTGAQYYGGPVQLVYPLIMEAGGGDVTFASTLQSSATPFDFNSLTVDTSGVATFSGAVDLGGELLRTGTGQTVIDGNITTVGTQYYQGPVTMNGSALEVTSAGNPVWLGGALTLNHDLTVTTQYSAAFSGPIDGPYNLTIDVAHNAVLLGAVGGASPLASLTTSASTTLIGADITTTGAQSYGGAVRLVANAALQTSNAPVSFSSTIDSYPGMPAANLSVTTGTGTQSYGGALGASSALGAVTLSSSNAASLSLPGITATGPVFIAAGGPLTLAGVDAGGDILASTQTGDLTIDGAVTTTSATATALTLEAGKSADRVASPGLADTNGDVVIASGGSLSIGAGGSGVIYTGSIAGSTGLSSVVGAGDFRYWSDTNGHTGYTTPLGSGISAIYREQPIFLVTVTAPGSGRTYDGVTTSATPSVTGIVNGDVGSPTGTVSITRGGAPAVLLNAGSYTLTATIPASGDLAGLGYAVQSESTSYTISPAILTVGLTGAVSKTYDGKTTASLTSANYLLSGTIYGSDVVTLNDPTSGSYANADIGTGKVVSVTGLALSNPNYTLASTTASAAIGVISSPASATSAAATVGLTSAASVTYEVVGASSTTIPNDILTTPLVTCTSLLSIPCQMTEIISPATIH